MILGKKRSADGKASGQYDFTSLTGSDKKKLLKELPNKFDGVIRPQTCGTVKEIWQKFSILYGTITCSKPTVEMINEYHEKAKEWVDLFLSLRDKIDGYRKKNSTPYMHIMVYHIPKFFSGQGVERKNDLARNIVLNKSQKWDNTGDILRLESRQWELRNQELASEEDI